jgi:hypothetical protein
MVSLVGWPIAAAQECIRTLPERDALRAHFVGQPMMLIEAEARGERKVRTDPDEHPAPGAVVDVEVGVLYPTLSVREVPPVLGFLADRNQPPRRFSRLENGDDVIGLGVSEIRLDELVARVTGRVEDRHVPGHGSVLHPVVVLPGDIAQQVATDRILVSIGAEESNDPFRLLKRLNEPIEQDPIEAAVGKANAILVMLVEGVHAVLQSCERS